MELRIVSENPQLIEEYKACEVVRVTVMVVYAVVVVEDVWVSTLVT